MESFWGFLKSALICHCRYETRREAIRDITEYIEIFYNRQRKQARLGYLSPATFERYFYGKRMPAKKTITGARNGCPMAWLVEI
jgi:putative transposase